jgi:hypothetical protein
MTEQRSDGGGGLGRVFAAILGLVGLVAAKSCIVAGHHIDDIGGAIARNAGHAIPVEAGADDAWRATRGSVGGAFDEADNWLIAAEQQSAEEGTQASVAPSVAHRIGDTATDFVDEAGREVLENGIQEALEEDDDNH